MTDHTIELRKGDRLVLTVSPLVSGASVALYKPKAGRPRIEDRDKTLAATEPWKASGMSRATWYARQAEKRK